MLTYQKGKAVVWGGVRGAPAHLFRSFFPGSRDTSGMAVLSASPTNSLAGLARRLHSIPGPCTAPLAVPVFLTSKGDPRKYSGCLEIIYVNIYNFLLQNKLLQIVFLVMLFISFVLIARPEVLSMLFSSTYSMRYLFEHKYKRKGKAFA
jgi:hypothetical protein